MSSYEFSTICDGRHMTVVVESATPERAESTIRRCTGASSVRLVGVDGVEIPVEPAPAS